MLNSALFILLTILRLVVVVLLTRTGLRKESRPVMWLAGLFYLNIIFSLSGAGVNIPLPLVIIFQGLAQICLVFFVYNTFYQGRTGPMKFFMGFTLLTIAAALVVAFTETTILLSVSASAFLLLTLSQLFNWSWHAFAAQRGLQNVAQDRYVADWVKNRYRLMIAYCLIFLVPVALSTFVSILPQVVVLLTFLLAFAVLVLQYLVWGMPDTFRKFLNRAYVEPALPNINEILSMSEEEIMGMAQK